MACSQFIPDRLCGETLLGNCYSITAQWGRRCWQDLLNQILETTVLGQLDPLRAQSAGADRGQYFRRGLYLAYLIAPITSPHYHTLMKDIIAPEHQRDEVREQQNTLGSHRVSTKQLRSDRKASRVLSPISIPE